MTAPQPQTLAALCDDILRTRPAPGEPATPIFYELIRELKRHAREGRFDSLDVVTPQGYGGNTTEGRNQEWPDGQP